MHPTGVRIAAYLAATIMIFGPAAVVGAGAAVSPSVHVVTAATDHFAAFAGRAGTQKASNWAGYAILTAHKAVSDVKGSWIEPSISGTCPAKSQYSSFWIGIDGDGTNTVEQTGTDSDCQSGKATYYAWYEFYPAFSVTIPLTIKAGDHISAEVSYSSSTHKFTTKLTDTTTKKSYSKTAAASTALRGSAEWIAEAPSNGVSILPLAHFNTVKFTNCTATISGKTAKISSFSWTQITMWNIGATKVKAQPSALTSTGDSFTVTWKSAGP